MGVASMWCTAAVAALLAAGCPESRPAAPSHCERIGDQCRLREGLLGVCSVTDDARCAEPPCLACAPQH